MAERFSPNMTARREGISVLGNGHRRSWSGVLVELWEAEGADGARAEYVSEHPRLFVLLDQAGGDIQFLLSAKGGANPRRHAPRQISFIPAGVPLWSRFEAPTYIRHLDLHFDMETLRERLADDFSREQFETPRLMFTDERMLGFANLIAAECASPAAFHELYGDSLTTALFIDFVRSGGRSASAARSPHGSSAGWSISSRRTACAASSCRNWPSWSACRPPISATLSRPPPACRRINGR
jgi:AraC family transcriptional regulator